MKKANCFEGICISKIADNLKHILYFIKRQIILSLSYYAELQYTIARNSSF